MYYIVHKENNQKADAFFSLEECIQQLTWIKPELRYRYYLESEELKSRFEGQGFARSDYERVWFYVRKEEN